MPRQIQNIGLMITCNEEDCIQEVMAEHTKYFDKILVLDGSSDRTDEILRSYPQVKYLLKDKDILDKLPNRKFEDGARQFLLEKAQEMFPIKGWFTLLHGDEIFHDDPNWAIEDAAQAGVERVNWYVMNFFLHPSDRGRNLEIIQSIKERVSWYHPGQIEIRQFRNKPGLCYQLSQRHNVVPKGVGWKIFKYFPIIRHYPHRSIRQMRQKMAQHEQSGFSNSYKMAVSENDCYLKEEKIFKVERKFDGSFHEFELKNQGSLLSRWFRAHRYM